MNFELDEVYTLKLNSGEELITKIVKDDGSYLQINDPVSVAPGPQGMGLVPSMFTADPEHPIMLNKSSVTVYGKTEENVKNKYIEATTGIKLPSKKIVLG
jgi:hypothetical protein